jgi:SAM-dependent methyltransferase
VPALFAGWAASLVDLAAPCPGERVLDVACGTGIVARRAASRVGATGVLAGLDADPSMIGVAREVSAGLVPPIRWCVGDASALPFPDESFDVVVCQQGLQFVPDAVAAVSEMRRVLAPDGRLAVSVWRGVQPGACSTALAATLERRIGGEAVEDMRTPCAFGDPERLRSLAARAGLRDIRIRIVVEKARAGSAAELLEQTVLMSSLAAPLERLGPGDRARLIGELDEALGPHAGEGGLAIPVEASVLVARR